MNTWIIGKKLNETSFPDKKDFYSHLSMQDITYADFEHKKRVCEDFEIKHLGDYHDLYVKSNALLLPDVFKNFRNMS